MEEEEAMQLKQGQSLDFHPLITRYTCACVLLHNSVTKSRAVSILACGMLYDSFARAWWRYAHCATCLAVICRLRQDRDIFGVLTGQYKYVPHEDVHMPRCLATALFDIMACGVAIALSPLASSVASCRLVKPYYFRGGFFLSPV